VLRLCRGLHIMVCSSFSFGHDVGLDLKPGHGLEA
jgi:hypothetical protein